MPGNQPPHEHPGCRSTPALRRARAEEGRLLGRKTAFWVWRGGGQLRSSRLMSLVNARHWAGVKNSTGLRGCLESLTAMPPPGRRAHMMHWPLADDRVLVNQVSVAGLVWFVMS